MLKTLKGLNVTCTRGILDKKAICYVWWIVGLTVWASGLKK